MQFPSYQSNLVGPSAAAGAGTNDRQSLQWLLSQRYQGQQVYAQRGFTEQTDSSTNYHTGINADSQSQPFSVPRFRPEWNNHSTFAHSSFDDLVNYPSDLENDKGSQLMPTHLQGLPSSFSFRPLDHAQPNWFPANNLPQYGNSNFGDWTVGTTEFEGSSVSSVQPRDYSSNTPEEAFINPPYDQSLTYVNTVSYPQLQASVNHLNPMDTSHYGLTHPNASFYQPNPSVPPNFHSWLNTQAQSAQFQYVSMDQVIQPPASRVHSQTPYLASNSQSPYDEAQIEGGDERAGNSENEEINIGDKNLTKSGHQSVHEDRSETPTIRGDRDHLLVKLRAEGWKYKDIKRTHGFAEAESTLRGRLRMLTKSKEQRVRKPEWQPKDITLLRHAVNHYNGDRRKKLSASQIHRKTPWKKVSERMTARGASYAFAASTCAKKWEEEFGDGKSK